MECISPFLYNVTVIEREEKGRIRKMSMLEVSGLKKIYQTRFGGNKVEALRNVNFTVEEGEFVAIMGE